MKQLGVTDMRRLLGIIVLAMSFSSPAWSTVRIDVSYDTIGNEIQPETKVVTSRGSGTTIILNNDGTVTKYSGNGISTNSLNGYVSSINRSGVNSVSHYKVSRGSITEFFENDYLRESIVVSTNGSNYCTAKVIIQPNRGQKYIVWNKDSGSYVSGERAINVTCRIQKTN